MNVDDTEEIEVPDSEFGRWQFAEPAGQKMDPAAARQLLRETVAGWAEDSRECFTMADLVELRERTGLSPPVGVQGARRDGRRRPDRAGRDDRRQVAHPAAVTRRRAGVGRVPGPPPVTGVMTAA